jgi:hypothetical protein
MNHGPPRYTSRRIPGIPRKFTNMRDDNVSAIVIKVKYK